MYLGIEIGGTKVLLGVGSGETTQLAALERREVDPQRGAAGILDEIERIGSQLVDRYDISQVGVGFGGPVNAQSGLALKSHHIHGWENFPLGDWCRRAFGHPAIVCNDCNAAAIAEACHGAGQGHRRVFYVTVGTGVGGGLVIDRELYGDDRPAVAEIGHLRPGLHDDRPDATVEALASGWGIVGETQARIGGDVSRLTDSLLEEENGLDRVERRLRIENASQAADEYVQDLLSRCGGEAERLTAKMVAQAADDGNEIAREVLRHAIQALGWAVAQVITLLAPEVVVVGGGVAQMGKPQFFTPLRAQVRRYVFPPLQKSFQLQPSRLGDQVVVQGAILMARGDVRTSPG